MYARAQSMKKIIILSLILGMYILERLVNNSLIFCPDTQ